MFSEKVNVIVIVFHENVKLVYEFCIVFNELGSVVYEQVSVCF